MTAWIPVCPSCGVEDWGIKGLGDAFKWQLFRRLICRQCGSHMDGMRIALVHP